MALSVTNYTNGEDITEDVLNRPIDEIVDYINGQKNVTYLLTNMSVTVGASGADFTRLQDAINFMCRFQPAHHDVRGTILIKTGFNLTSPTEINNCNLGWCRVESEDATVFMDPAAASVPEYIGSLVNVGFRISRSYAPVFDTNFAVTSTGYNNYYMFGVYDESHLAFDVATLTGPTGTNAGAVHARSFGSIFLIGCTANNLQLGGSSRLLIDGGSFENLSVDGGSTASIGGTSGTKDTNIPVNTLTSNGIIFS